jgi:hypothetical protein
MRSGQVAARASPQRRSRTVITVAGFAHGRTARRNGAPLVLACARGRVCARRSLPRPLIARRLAAAAYG